MGTSLKEKVLRVVSNSRVPLSTREIAEMLGLSPDAVDGLIKRARNNLKKALHDYL